MIRCCKCDTPVIRESNGVLRMACECWPPRLYQHGGIRAFTYTTEISGTTGAIPAESFSLSVPDGLQYCEGCGTPMLQPEHTCRKVPITQDAIKPKQRDDLTPSMAERLSILLEDARIEAEPEYQHRMKQCLEHLKTCSSCAYLAQIDGSACPDLRKLRAARDDKLIKKAKV